MFLFRAIFRQRNESEDEERGHALEVTLAEVRDDYEARQRGEPSTYMYFLGNSEIDAVQRLTNGKLLVELCDGRHYELPVYATAVAVDTAYFDVTDDEEQ